MPRILQRTYQNLQYHIITEFGASPVLGPEIGGVRHGSVVKA